MKFGVIGVEQQTLKLFLPLYFENRNQGDFMFAVKDPNIKKQLMQRYQVDYLYQSLDQLIAGGIDACFIHGSSAEQLKLAERCLQKGIHVFIDRPVGESLTEIKSLQRLALDNRRIFMLGFNRRFAPMVDQLKKVSNKRLLSVQKNLCEFKRPVVDMVNELFIHLVDTAVYLIDEPIQNVTSQIKDTDGLLETAVMQLETEHTAAWVALDAQAGTDNEQIQLTSGSGCGTLKNLQQLELETAAVKKSWEPEKWATPLEVYGFSQMVTAFIQAVRSQTSTKLKQKNICLSHKLCADVLTTYQADH
ncbi:MAG: Gfo/Idh/MocA family oxidoreductase [Liquorilactobacillus ghanensis]|uniref:Gfo/Idh/MocA family protein n=1 Tax=Liquorilactobacillus ghanensis TaxID=399370 RepID=UPI0039EA4A33